MRNRFSMFNKYTCTQCGNKLKFNRKETVYQCENCGNIITLEEMFQKEFFTSSGELKPKAVRKALLTIFIIMVIFAAIFATAFIFAFTVRHSVTISVYSQNYNGPVKIYIDGREVYSDEIIVGETIEKIFSLRSDRYRITIYYGDREINDIEEITHDEEISFTLR